MKKFNFYTTALLATLYVSSMQAMIVKEKSVAKILQEKVGVSAVSSDDAARVSLQPHVDVDSSIGTRTLFTTLNRIAHNNQSVASQLLDDDSEFHNVWTIHAHSELSQVFEFLKNVHRVEHLLIDMYDHACQACAAMTKANATKSAHDKELMKETTKLLIADYKEMLCEEVFQESNNLELIGTWHRKVCTQDDEAALVVADREVLAPFWGGLSEITSLVTDFVINAEEQNRKTRTQAGLVIIDKVNKAIPLMDAALAKLTSVAFYEVINSFWSEWKEQLPKFFTVP